MLSICRECGTAYSVGADGCPHCGADDPVDQGSPEHEAMAERADDTDAAAGVGVAPTPAEIREWARGEGVEVADGGPIPAAVLEQYEAAHPGGGEDEKS